MPSDGFSLSNRGDSISSRPPSVMPNVLRVRVAMAMPGLSSLRRGPTKFSHMPVISRGGPGRAAMTRSPRRTHQPGAVPMGFGITSAEGMSVACLTFVSGIRMPRLSNPALRLASRSSCTSIVSPMAAAMDSRVRSSEVGPRPPVVTVTSERSQARLIASSRRLGWSPTLVAHVRSMPMRASRSPM